LRTGSHFIVTTNCTDADKWFHPFALFLVK
jgi:hypothetical protein